MNRRWRLCLLFISAVFCQLARVGDAGSASALERTPRYVLCDHVAQLAVADLPGGRLSVFAASVAAEEGQTGRLPAALALQAALLFEGPSAWGTRLPTVDGANPSAGHAAHVSYAKCFGAELPKNARVGCRVHTSATSLRSRPRAKRENATWSAISPGRLARFRNGEVQHDFAHCVLGAPTLRWRSSRGRGPPDRLRMQLLVDLPDGSEFGDTARATLPLELCRVRRPLMRISFCSQPLYGLDGLRQELPWVVDDWLAYHLDHLGFQHAELYDIDGSLAAPLDRWLSRRSRSSRGRQAYRRGSVGSRATVSYRRLWPANLSRNLAAVSVKHPYCTETWAYAHCLTTHRALSRWVMLLHAPDEYVITRGNMSVGSLLQKLTEVEMEMDFSAPAGGQLPMLLVRAASFARGQVGGDVTDARQSAMERGAVVARSQVRGEAWYRHTPLVDPFVCMCAGAHSCYAEVGRSGGYVDTVGTSKMRVHHYVEMLRRNVGRCAQQHKECGTQDVSAMSLVPLIRSFGD